MHPSTSQQALEQASADPLPNPSAEVTAVPQRLATPLPATDDRTARQQAQDAEQSQILDQKLHSRLYSPSGRLLIPAPLRGSHEVLVHQNTMADDEGLSRIEDNEQLDRFRAAGLLVDFVPGVSLRLNPTLPLNRRCARPWTVRFTQDIARAFYARFHQPLELNSAVRTVRYQMRLQRINGNAAPTEGETASPHLTGQAVDLGKRELSTLQLAWMRAYLLPLMDSGQIDVEEEFQQACFHISVYRRYASPRPSRRRPGATDLAQSRPPASHSPDDNLQ